MEIEENGKATSSEDSNMKWKTEEDNSSGTAEQANPFDDPVHRTKCLIQYIRLRKQRAEAEQAKRNAIKKQKMTARATLQSAREEKASAEAEERQCAMKIEELNQEKHQVLAALKAIHSRETERKRKREEQERQRRALAEEQRRREEQRRMAAQQQPQQQQQQQSLAALEYLLQLKNAQLSAIIASATGENTQLGTPAVGGHSLASSLPPSILSLLMQNSLADVAGSAPQNVQVGSAAPSLPLTANSFANFPTTTHNQPQQRMVTAPPQNQSSSSTNVMNQQHPSQQHQMHLQQQQVQNAVAQLLRQQFPTSAPGIMGMNALLNAAGISGGQSQIGQAFPNIGTFPAHQHQFDLQSLAAAAAQPHHHQQQQQQLSSALNLQALVGGGAVHQPPTPITSSAASNNIPGISQELLFQATLLAAANLSNPGLITPNTAPQQQQRPK
ncbi:hypothetical protein niasHT_007300 [Heterodera trifolii]|uniref:Uncharacterized protein n=1 Tax=Heterodera trifolii TaxID=157864 RepID=A0ABD2IJB7_9BILA